MLRTTLLLVAILGLVAPAAARQNKAHATFYTRASGDRVAAAIVIGIDESWYLYHTDLGGDPAAVGKVTTFAFDSPGIEWGPVVMTGAKRKEVDEPGVGKYSYLRHTGRAYAYAVGRRSSPGAEGAAPEVALAGLTCSDTTGMCVDYAETIAARGPGSDRAWADWPAELGPSPLAAAEPAQPAAGEAVEGTVREGPPGTELADATPAEAPVPLGPPVKVAPGQDDRGGSVDFGGSGTGDLVRGKVFVRVDEDGETVHAAVVLEIAAGYHIAHGPTVEDLAGHPDAVGNPTVLAIEGGGVEWGAARYPAPARHDEGYSGDDGEPVWSWVHEGTVRLLVDGLLVDDELDPEELNVSVRGQACKATCTDFALTAAYAGAGDDADFAPLAEAGAAAGGDAAPSGPVAPTADGAAAATPPPSRPGIGRYLLLAVVWGLVTLLMPCTYPMIPITISYFTKQAIARDGKVLPLALAYGGGIVGMFVLLGAVLGKPVQVFANHPVTQLVIGGLFVFFALVLWGIVELRPPRALLQAAGKASQKGGLGGVFLMGTTLVVTSFSCTAPFVGDIIARGATQGIVRPMVGMGVFGLTMAVPFVFLSLFPARLQRLPSAGEWMHVLKVSLGFVEFAAAFKFLSGADLVWDLRLLPDERFLAVWIGTFLALAFFLFGWIRLKGETEHEIGPGRMACGAVTLIFAAYLGTGVLGFRLDPVMTSILPGYRAERVGTWGGGGGAAGVKERLIVKDDLQAALAAAANEEKLVLLNFTGFN